MRQTALGNRVLSPRGPSDCCRQSLIAGNAWNSQRRERATMNIADGPKLRHCWRLA
jgi:hypothetical protein